jgi:hypothetical protein
MNNKKVLTSTRVYEHLFEEFKVRAIKRKLTFADLVNRSLFLYNTDADFRNLINNTLKIK